MIMWTRLNSMSMYVSCLCSFCNFSYFILLCTLMAVRAAIGLDILLLIMPFLYRFYVCTISETWIGSVNEMSYCVEYNESDEHEALQVESNNKEVEKLDEKISGQRKQSETSSSHKSIQYAFTRCHEKFHFYSLYITIHVLLQGYIHLHWNCVDQKQHFIKKKD